MTIKISRKDLASLTRPPAAAKERKSAERRRAKKVIARAGADPITARPFIGKRGIIVHVPWHQIDLSILNAHTSRNKSFQKVEETKRLRAATLAACRPSSIAPLGSIKCDLYIKITPPNHIARDALNMAQACKPIIDGIVDAGIVDDDKAKIICAVTVTVSEPNESEAGYAIFLTESSYACII